jgi:hypothetical protein
VPMCFPVFWGRSGACGVAGGAAVSHLFLSVSQRPFACFCLSMLS